MSNSSNPSRLSPQDVDVIKLIAETLWDSTDGKITSRLTPKQAFMIGFLNSREYTLEQLGIFDDEELAANA